MSSQEYKIRTFVMPDGNSFTFKDFEVYQDVQSFPATGSSSIIYLDAASSLLYYWTGSEYTLFSFAPKESPNFTGSIKLGNTRPTIGTNSVALGSGALASGNNSIALSSGNATGAESVALGSGCQATEARSFAQGEASRATASCAIALGGGTTASAYGAFAEGVGGTASGYASHKEGYGCYVTQEAAHAEGRGTRANGAASHTEGQGTIANGVASHVGGMCNIGDSYSNWAEWVANTSYSVGDKVKVTNGTTVTGYVCKTANSDSSFTASNWDVDEKMNYAEIIGNGTADNARSNARSLDWNGNEYLKGDLYVGCNSDSTGGTKVAKLSDVPDASSFAPKASPVFTGSISLGRNTPSTVGTGSIAVGTTNTASGQYSQAYGDSASATAQGAYASGYYASASGSYSHAEGGSTTANHAYQHVFGTFNNSDPSSNVATSKGTYVEIVGNGTGAVSPSNARALDWNGNEYLKGDIYVGCNAASSNGSKVATESFVTTNITSLNQAITSANEAISTLNANVMADGAGSHNAIYRGKYLGDSVTSEQWAAINAGTFDDLYIGDYWTIGGVYWRIAAFDYWVNADNLSTHHVVIVPDSTLASSSMNSTNTTSGAYYNSDFRTGNNSNTGRATAITAVNNAFGSEHILTYKDYLHSAVTDGHPSGMEWANCTVELMNEEMVYGNHIFAPVSSGSSVYSKYTTSKSQLPLFQHEHSRICNRSYWWLRDVVSDSRFAFVLANGSASNNNASGVLGVRPAFGIYQS